MQRNRVPLFATAAGLMLVAGAAAVAGQAQERQKPAAAQAKHVMMSADELKWGPGPPALPAGAQLAVLDGDPSKPGLFNIRAKLPDGYTVPPHSHPTDEHVTVVSGTLSVGMGAKADESAMLAMTAGGYAKMAARTNHYVRAKGETIIQITAMGPFEVKYVNPADDPRKKDTTRK